MEEIRYRGKSYPMRQVEIPGYGVRRIATTDLADELLPDGENYADEEAKRIDNGIFFYVDRFCLLHTEEVLAKLVYRQITE